MRWYWIDRFTEFVSGQYARSIKTVTLAESHISDHFPGAPTMPASLITEGIAQTGGLLVGQHSDFEERVVLAKLSKIKFHFEAVAGETLTYYAKIEDIHPDGAIVSATSHVGDRLQAEAQLVFAHLIGPHANRQLFKPIEFVTLLRVFRLFDVAVNPDGSPVQVPKRLLEAEQRAMGD